MIDIFICHNFICLARKKLHTHPLPVSFIYGSVFASKQKFLFFLFNMKGWSNDMPLLSFPCQSKANPHIKKITSNPSLSCPQTRGPCWSCRSICASTASSWSMSAASAASQTPRTSSMSRTNRNYRSMKCGVMFWWSFCFPILKQ